MEGFCEFVWVVLYFGSYIIGGVLNSHLSSLWARPRMGFWPSVAIVVSKIMVILYLFLATVFAIFAIYAFYDFVSSDEA